MVTVNDGSNDDDDDNNDDEAIWESFDSDAAVVLLCEGCEDEVHLSCRALAAVPDGIGFAECVSRRLLRKRPRESWARSWLLQNKFTKLILNARRKSKMLVVVMTTKTTTQMKIKFAYETL